MNILETFKEGITVQHKQWDDLKTKNRKRFSAINIHFSHFSLSKEKFLTYIQENHLHKGKTDLFNKIENIDFSKANPRNTLFMNELAFAGEAIVEGFLEVFTIERDKAIEKYQNQLQVIEHCSEEGELHFYIGTFQNKKLKRLTAYQDNKQELQAYLKKKDSFDQKEIYKRRNGAQLSIKNDED